MSNADGTVIGNTKIIDHGPNNRRFNLVVLAEGYQQAELAKFAGDASGVANAWLATPPFDLVRTAVNVHRVDVASAESGADIPCAAPPTSARTFFDATYCASGIERLLVVNSAAAVAVAHSQVPNHPRVLALVNHAKYGGSGGPGTAVCSLDAASIRIAIHEMGHSFFDVADEYLEGLTTDPATDYWANRVNTARTKDAAGRVVVKWPALVGATTPNPTTVNASCTVAFDASPSPVPVGTVGAFEGAARYNCGVWRPEYRCIMGTDLTQPFCSVCRAQILHVMEPFIQRPVEIYREPWSLGWTTIAPFHLGGQPHLISYKVGDGSVSIDRIRPDGMGTDHLLGGAWTTGWTSFVPMATAAGQFLLIYKLVTGEAEIDQISADGQNVSGVLNMAWNPGFTQMVAFDLPAGPHLLSYSIGSGAASIDSLRADGSQFDNTMTSTWSTDWSSLVPMAVRGRQFLLSYKATTGDMQINEITPDGRNVNVLSRHLWSTDWTSFAPFAIDGDVFYVAYKASTGEMALDRVRPDGSGVDTLLWGPWAKDWAIFAPFVLGGVPHQLVYRATDGTAATDRIW